MSISDARIRSAFAAFDFEGKGKISLDALERLLRAFGFRDNSKQLVASWMRAAVQTRSSINEVSLDDTRRIILSNYIENNTEDCYSVYSSMDRSETGRLSTLDLADAAAKHGGFDRLLPPNIHLFNGNNTLSSADLSRSHSSSPTTPKHQNHRSRSAGIHNAHAPLGGTSTGEEVVHPPPRAVRATSQHDDDPSSMEKNAQSNNGKEEEASTSTSRHAEATKRLATSAKHRNRLQQLVQAFAEYPDRGVTFEEWRKLQVRACEGGAAGVGFNKRLSSESSLNNTLRPTMSLYRMGTSAAF